MAERRLSMPFGVVRAWGRAEEKGVSDGGSDRPWERDFFFFLGGGVA